MVVTWVFLVTCSFLDNCAWQECNTYIYHYHTQHIKLNILYSNFSVIELSFSQRLPHLHGTFWSIKNAGSQEVTSLGPFELYERVKYSRFPPFFLWRHHAVLLPS